MDSLVDLPASETVPDEKPKSEINGMKNFANVRATVEKVKARAKFQLEKYRTQSKRLAYENVMKDADAMFRMAAHQTKQAENKTSNEMDTIPDIFYRIHRAITASESEIVITAKNAPGTYEPMEYLDALTRDATLKNCESQNLILEYSRVSDKRKDKEEHAFWTVNKYGNCILGMEWYQASWKTRERRPVKSSGNVEATDTVRYEWVETTQTEAYPSLSIYDFSDVWADAMIDGFQEQSTFMIRSYPTLNEIFRRQELGDYINADKITKSDYYQQRYPDKVKLQRASNAGDAGNENNITGQLDMWHVWMRAPIDEDTGKWDEKRTAAKWWLATFVGNINMASDPVCVRLIRNPYWWNRDQVPYLVLHSHRDDNGLYHAGYAKYIKPAYDEYKTTLDQWFYNKNLINAAPFKTEFGAIFNQRTDFGPHSLITMHQGQFDKLERIDVKDNTQNTQPFIGYLEDRIKKVGDTNDAFMGNALGGRTSASEADRVYTQARLPSMAALRYKANQLYPWMAEWDAAMWRQYADADLTLALTRKGEVREIKPATVWGPMRYKVTAVDDYDRTSVARHESDRFLQTTLPIYVQVAGKRSTMRLLAWIYGQRDFPPELFPESADLDARHVATNENEHFVAGNWVAPVEGQDHDIHLGIHESFLAIYQCVGDHDPAVVEKLKAHNQMHEQMKQREAAGMQSAINQTQAQQQMAGMGDAGSPPMTSGEVAGDAMGATGGGMMA